MFHGLECKYEGNFYNKRMSMAQHFRHQHGGTSNMVVEGDDGVGKVIETINIVTSPASPDEKEVAAVIADINRYGGTPSSDFFNAAGRRYYDVISKAMHAKPRVPVGLVGPTGHGKSTFIDMIAQDAPWNGKYSVQGYNASMDLDTTIGAMYPVPDPTKLVEWHDGKLTVEARRGGVYHAEEFSNANMDLVSRLHQVMDEGARRFLDLIESLERSLSCHEDFCMVSSWNNPGKGYAGTRLTEPIMHRFGYVIIMDKTVVNEPKLLKTYMADETARRVMNLVAELRRNPDTWVSTRDVKLLGQAVANGFEPLDAIEYSLLGKFTATPELRNAVRTLAKARFDAETVAPSMPTEEEL